jgi:hypothetical protein
VCEGETWKDQGSNQRQREQDFVKG